MHKITTKEKYINEHKQAEEVIQIYVYVRGGFLPLSLVRFIIHCDDSMNGFLY